VEMDRALLPALEEVVGPPRVRPAAARATRCGSTGFRVLPGRGWKMVSNLPYNVAVPLVMDMLEGGTRDRLVSFVMVQREVGERLAAGPGEPAVRCRERSGRVPRPEASVVRRVPASVFCRGRRWIRCSVRIVRRPAPARRGAIPSGCSASWTPASGSGGRRCERAPSARPLRCRGGRRARALWPSPPARAPRALARGLRPTGGGRLMTGERYDATRTRRSTSSSGC